FSLAKSRPQSGDSVERLREILAEPTSPYRRAAAVALGKSQATRSIDALFDAVRKGGIDRLLEHSILYALIEIHDWKHTVSFLSDPNPQLRRAALIALDQMDGGNLTREQVIPLLDTDDPQLRKAALAVINSRKGWATELVALLRGWLAEKQPSEEHLSLLRGTLLAQA